VAAHWRLERIVDGNTLVLARVSAVRLIGVDTPESKHPLKPVGGLLARGDGVPGAARAVAVPIKV
jgi:endonuclease YncB( thermonuclease family)